MEMEWKHNERDGDRVRQIRTLAAWEQNKLSAVKAEYLRLKLNLSILLKQVLLKTISLLFLLIYCTPSR